MATTTTSKGMIFLDPGNMIIESTVREKTKPGAKLEPMEVRMADFDGVTYRMLVEQANLKIMYVSISMPVYAELLKYGAQVVLNEQYPNMVIETPHEGYDLTLHFDCENPPFGQDELVKRISQLKRNLLGAPFDQCFAALTHDQGSALPPISINVRPLPHAEAIFVIPKGDRIVIILSIDFPDTTDQAIARVFLQEFADTQRQVNNSPPCSFSKDPPLELQGAPNLPNSSSFVGFISFAIFKAHVEGPKRERTVTLITGFRNYLHYHIKASKSYLHSRMRKRCVALLQVLNRAVPDKDASKTSKKLASGKTFIRR